LSRTGPARSRTRAKDQTYKDQDKERTCKDKDLNLVLKESLRTKTRINITG